ncbi:unnamed protein product [marine sediment metagenome]|uniref:UmuC domain-containing protein n=1 Tax=marine sediment metagenome TaxID=412755 RepID=X1B0C0_9ZZZZ
MSRFILHCDLDYFFAAVEARDNPKYIGKPLVIGADPKNGKGRGVVSTCNYEARKFGLHSAMPISQAFKRCPHGIYLHPNFEKYQKASKEVMEIVNSYSDMFQQVSIDEAFLDVSDKCTNYKEVRSLAEKLKNEVQKKVGITISIGCAPTKSIAKIRVSNKNDFKKFRICHSLHYNKPWVLDFARSIGVSNFIPLDSMAKLCMVADGSSELYIKPMNMQRSFTWDFLPGELLVKEAGGKITDIRGNPIQYVNDKCKITAPGLIASNGIKHEELLSYLKSNDILKNS